MEVDIKRGGDFCGQNDENHGLSWLNHEVNCSSQHELAQQVELKIKRNDWLLAGMCPQAANHCTLF